VARAGGTIICAAECRDGLPDHGAYGELLAARETPAELLTMIERSSATIPDQWQVQIQARIQVAHRVMLKADGLSAAQVRAAHIEPIEDVTETIERLLAASPDSSICVLPQGPQTIPYVS
jgi:nickel-dependent lactate racemase